jgi:hypothetical protein
MHSTSWAYNEATFGAALMLLLLTNPQREIEQRAKAVL